MDRPKVYISNYVTLKKLDVNKLIIGLYEYTTNIIIHNGRNIAKSFKYYTYSQTKSIYTACTET